MLGVYLCVCACECVVAAGCCSFKVHWRVLGIAWNAAVAKQLLAVLVMLGELLACRAHCWQLFCKCFVLAG
jgi:hypothetical protein